MSAPQHGKHGGDSAAAGGVTGAGAPQNVQYHAIPAFTSQTLSGARGLTGFTNPGSAGPTLTDV